MYSDRPKSCVIAIRCDLVTSRLLGNPSPDQLIVHVELSRSTMIMSTVLVSDFLSLKFLTFLAHIIIVLKLSTKAYVIFSFDCITWFPQLIAIIAWYSFYQENSQYSIEYCEILWIITTRKILPMNYFLQLT